MKWSKYNYLFETADNKQFLYNSYTNNFIKLLPNDYKTLNECAVGNINMTQESIDRLKHENILVESDTAIYNKIKLQRLLTRFDKRYLSLTIAPTLSCNFACPYCYEKDNVASTNQMSTKVINGIIDFIKSHNEMQFLRVTWYGGEPLLAYNKIQKITDEILKLNINYQADIITNGYLLNKKIISNLKSLQINQLQITLDGLEQTHNIRRPHKQNSNSFQVIIKNLKDLYEIIPDVKVGLRVNVDKTNQEEYHELYYYLRQLIPSDNLFIHPGYVTDIYSTKCKSSCLFHKSDKLDFMAQQFDKHLIPMTFYPKTGFGECTARHINSFVVGPKGELYKCWNDIGIESKAIGDIFNFYPSDLFVEYLVEADPLSSLECKECFYFPICDGGCPYSRIESEHSSTSIDTCVEIKNNLNSFLFNHYKIKNSDQKL